nr:MAG: capsid protein [XiangYun toti-like virus 5]
MCFLNFGRLQYRATNKRFPGDLDDSRDTRRSTQVTIQRRHLPTVLFRTKVKMAALQKEALPKRVTRQTTRLGLAPDPKPVSSRAELLVAAKVGKKIPGARSSLGQRTTGAASPAMPVYSSPAPSTSGTTVTPITEETSGNGTSATVSNSASTMESVAVGADGSVTVIKEVAPLDTSVMEVDNPDEDDGATAKAADPPTNFDEALEALNFKPGATVTQEMMDALMAAVKVNSVAAAGRARLPSKRIPMFPNEEVGLPRIYNNAAMSEHQQHEAGLHHVDARVASAVARDRVPHRMTNAVPPAAAPPAAPGFVPVPGPEFSPNAPVQIDGSGKVGNESVYLKDVIGTSVRASTEQSQDIITRICEWHAGNQGAVEDENDHMTLIGTYVLPTLAGTSPHIQCAEHFVRLVNAQDPIRNFEVSWDNYLETAKVPEAARSTFLVGGNPESKTIVSQLRAKADVSNAMANRLCTRLYDASSQYALEGMFFVLFFMADYKYTAEQLEIVVQLQEAAQGALVHINLAADGDNIAPAIAAAEEAITTKRICLNRAHLNAAHYNVLRMISRGPAALVGNDVVQMIHSYFRTPQINFALYDVAEHVAVNLATPTAQQIWASAFHFAKLLHAEADLVRGWVRAQCTVNGKHYVDDDRRGPYYTATLELEFMSMPKPVGRNFLWDFFCDRFETIEPLQGVEMEYNSLATLTMPSSRYIGAILAGLVTVNVSTYLNYFNIGGLEMNEWAQGTAAPVVHLLKAALTTRSRHVPPIFQCTASNITACTGFVISPSCFRTRGFCALFTAGELDDEDGWFGTWSRRVPYLIRVLCLGWLFSAWHSVWGISGPYPSIHVGSELFSTLPDGVRLVCLHMGDDSYHKVAQCGTPFVYVIYGMQFMNIYRQMMRVATNARVRYITITRAQSGAIAYGNQFVDDNDLQPLLCEASFCWVEGTLPTFDWPTLRVLAPVLSEPTWPDMHYNTMLTIGRREAALAGLAVRRDVRFCAVRRDNLDISVVLGLSAGGEAVAAAQPTAPQNEGN